MSSSSASDISSDLHTPIQRKASGAVAALAGFMPKLRNGIGLFNRVGGALLVVLALGLGAWVLLTEERLGGEPVALSSIQIAVPESSTTTPAVDPQTQSGSQIVRPPLPEPLQPGQPRVLQVAPVTVNEPATPDELADAQGDGTRVSDAFAPRFDSQGGLTDVPNGSLIQRFDEQSFVPLLGPSGQRPLDAYARPVEAGTIAPGTPRIAVIVSGLGLSQTATQAVIDRLPGEMTLSFAPYGNSLNRWTSRARAEGHEYLIEVPMEPFDYPNNDPGPHTLLASLEGPANIERMHWALSRVGTPVGYMNYMGGRFSSEPDALRPVLNDALGRGLMVVDDGQSARSRTMDVAGEDQPVLRSDVVIDARLDTTSILSRLTQLETLARERGSAVGVASALPVTIDILEEWATSLRGKGIVLVPVSSMVRF